MTRDEYCGTCHGKIHKRSAEHSRHSPGVTECVDCHTPQVAGGGERYSIHDHKFDFSGPELDCAECHGTDEVSGKKKEKHDFHFGRVKLRETLTMEQACASCHPGKPVSAALKTWKTGGE